MTGRGGGGGDGGSDIPEGAKGYGWRYYGKGDTRVVWPGEKQSCRPLHIKRDE